MKMIRRNMLRAVETVATSMMLTACGTGGRNSPNSISDGRVINTGEHRVTRS